MSKQSFDIDDFTIMKIDALYQPSSKETYQCILLVVII